MRNCVLIINEGAIPHMLAGAKDGDIVTKQSCCAVLSTLSSKASIDGDSDCASDGQLTACVRALLCVRVSRGLLSR